MYVREVERRDGEGKVRAVAVIEVQKNDGRSLPVAHGLDPELALIITTRWAWSCANVKARVPC
jgi:hypothetical protein